ncbi:MAG: LamG domain-containing protein [Myxococcales bacterium]|jgi:hypothetical protein|nr:LamG domain-containing protein [Myxococcales bacterium]
MRFAHEIRALSWIACAAALVAGCAGSTPNGPSFGVSFDSTLARSARDRAVRVEVYLVDSCADVTLGMRPVPVVASTYVLRDGEDGAFDDTPDAGDYGLYALAQDEDCAVVAAGCSPVTIASSNDTLEVTLSTFNVDGCDSDQTCSIQTGNCVDGTGGTGGTGGMPLMRVDAGLILLYAFDEGSGSTVADQSGVLPEHDLIVADPGNVAWSANHLTINTATALSTAGAATKLATRAKASGELTVEAWINPANFTQTGPARIISMSTDTGNRNFLLGQSTSTYAARFRADGELDWANGNPTVFTTAGTATTALTHVVYTHSSDGAEVLYVDGVENQTFMRTGGLTPWDGTYPILVANEATRDRAWLGELHLIAVYDRALDVGEVTQNFMAGP